MNVYGQRPLNVTSIQTMAQALATVKQDAALYEAFVLDTTDAGVANYSNARLFILTRPSLTDFADAPFRRIASSYVALFLIA